MEKQYELSHYGVLGMKWGHRKGRTPTSALPKSRIRKSYDSAKLNKKGTRDEYLKVKKARRDAYLKVKKERAEKIKKEYDKFQKNASKKEKFLYNDATRRAAAKYVVDHNMKASEAAQRAKGDAKRNAAIIVGVYGALTVAELAMRR